MNFQTLLIDLQQMGYSQTKIAQAVGCSIPAINDLISGNSRMPSYRLGSAIVEMHKAAKRKAKRKAARAAKDTPCT